MIAAVAINLGARLYTLDPKHFKPLGAHGLIVHLSHGFASIPGDRFDSTSSARHVLCQAASS